MDQLYTDFKPGLLYSWIDNGAVICMHVYPEAIKFGYLQINFKEDVNRMNLPIDLKHNRRSLHKYPKSAYEFSMWTQVNEAIFHNKGVTHTSLVPRKEAPYWFVPVSLIFRKDIERYLGVLRKDMNLTYR